MPGREFHELKALLHDDFGPFAVRYVLGYHGNPPQRWIGCRFERTIFSTENQGCFEGSRLLTSEDLFIDHFDPGLFPGPPQNILHRSTDRLTCRETRQHFRGFIPMGITQILIHFEQDIGNTICQRSIMRFAHAQGVFHSLAFQELLLHDFVQTCIFKSDRGLIGEGGQQALVLFRKGIRHFTFHSNYTDDALPDFKRHIEARLDSGMCIDVLRVPVDIPRSQRHTGLNDPAAQSLPNLIDASDEMLFCIRSFLFFQTGQVERNKLQVISSFLAQPDRHVMPGQVAGKGLYDAVANLTRLKQAADRQAIFIDGLQF